MYFLYCIYHFSCFLFFHSISAWNNDSSLSVRKEAINIRLENTEMGEEGQIWIFFGGRGAFQMEGNIQFLDMICCLFVQVLVRTEIKHLKSQTISSIFPYCCAAWLLFCQMAFRLHLLSAWQEQESMSMVYFEMYSSRIPMDLLHAFFLGYGILGSCLIPSRQCTFYVHFCYWKKLWKHNFRHI